MLVEMISELLNGSLLSHIGQTIGADSARTRQAVRMAIPVLVGGLARNATASAEGARTLAEALDQDLDGGMLAQLEGLMGHLGEGEQGKGLGGFLKGMSSRTPQASGSDAASGPGKDALLVHLLGDRGQRVARALGEEVGLDTDQALRVLSMLAPLVMAGLGKLKRQNRLDADGLAVLLQHERVEMTGRAATLDGLLQMLDSEEGTDVRENLLRRGGDLLDSFRN